MFKGKLWKKILFSFLMLVLMFFIFVNYPFKHWMIMRVEEKEFAEMKRTAGHCYDIYLASVDQDQVSLDSYMDTLRTAQYYTGYRIWIVGNDGEIIADTDSSNTIGKNIKENNSDYLNQTELVNEHIDNILKDDNLSYILPIIYNHETRGYLVIHRNYTFVISSAEENLFWANIVGIIAGLLALGGAAFYSFHYTKVLNTLIKRTADYTADKYERKGKIMHFKDEHQDLANAIDYLAEKNEGLVEYQKNFIANISHDFRSPLTSIRGYTVAMKDGTIPVEAQGKYLDIILFETDRLTGLTQDLLQLNEFDNNAIKLDFRKINICALIKQSAQTFEAICASKDIKMRLIFAEREINVNADKSKLQQVLHNLIDNAIKFSEKGGMITITVSEKDNKAYVSVKDNGIGIPKAAIGQIWERFYKTDLSRGKDKKGTGLGLSITKQIINAHGEQIVVDSVVGEGTEFTFSLTRIQ